MLRSFALVCLLIIAAWGTSPCPKVWAASAKIGQPAPLFSLPNVLTGQPAPLQSLVTTHQAVVLVFLSARCPVSNAYETRLMALAHRYASKGVALVGINASHDEPLTEIANHVKTHHFVFPVLKDGNGAVADQYGASVTPETYVISKRGILIYHGRVDNSMDPAGVKTHELADAIQHILAAKPIVRPETKAFGCSIDRASFVALPVSVAAHSHPTSAVDFDFQDPKQINAVSITLDSPLEPITGLADGVSGHLHFDPNNLRATTGQIIVDPASLTFSNAGYTNTAHGYGLDSKKYPEIKFTLIKVRTLFKVTPNSYRGTVAASFTCHGVTRPLTVPVTALYLPGEAPQRTNDQHKGDVLVLHTHFVIRRSDYHIADGVDTKLITDQIEITAGVVGLHLVN